ncbi:Mini-ribonuclease 3 [Acutalibacter muris]|uniref:Mini-ribonuclease 3 n=1 Tax=Acutalibacter muris TaxID=1796620 RepID=UPI00272C3712|nr:ribonuclease III domain-containing protein [Acutalibacter muris]
MDTLLKAPCPDMRRMSALDLAFVGDGVYDLLAREYLLQEGPSPVKKLHVRKTALVCCKAQSRALAGLWEGLSQEEREIALRGRNAHVGHVPKNADIADYHGATALEALFGWLYLIGGIDRARELFLLAVEVLG